MPSTRVLGKRPSEKKAHAPVSWRVRLHFSQTNDRQTDRQDRHTGHTGQADRQDRQTDRQDRQAGRPTDGQTDRQTDSGQTDQTDQTASTHRHTDRNLPPLHQHRPAGV